MESLQQQSGLSTTTDPQAIGQQNLVQPRNDLQPQQNLGTNLPQISGQLTVAPSCITNCQQSTPAQPVTVTSTQDVSNVVFPGMLVVAIVAIAIFARRVLSA
jgi:hypothetical protein